MTLSEYQKAASRTCPDLGSDKLIGRIYCLRDPVTKDIKYIGKTRISLEKRLNIHFTHRNLEKNIKNTNAEWIPYSL